MKLEDFKIYFMLLLPFLSFMINFEKVDAKTVCTYQEPSSGSTIELVAEKNNVKSYLNDQIKEYSLNFEILDGKCPQDIYESNDELYGFFHEDIPSTKFILIDSYSNKVTCGNITGIPKKIPQLTSMIVTIIQIAIPVILVVMGMLDLFKGVTAQKEDEIKKGQQIFIKRLIYAAIIFFVVIFVKFLISIVADSSTENIVDCIDCFISNDC